MQAKLSPEMPRFRFNRQHPTWGKEGARVVTHEGECDVAYQDLKGLGVHPDVAAEQPDVMAQGAAKAAGPATPQEDRPVQPTRYTLDDFEIGQHVTAVTKPAPGAPANAGATYTGTVTAIGMKADPNLINMKLDTPTKQGMTSLWVYPHEVTGIDEPQEEPEVKESSTSASTSGDTKKNGEETGSAETPTREAEKAGKVGQHL
jgi:hypothetical protein